MSQALIIAARRTAVAPRGGAFRDVEAADLAAVTIRALLDDMALPPETVDEVILGNALYGGGNPARVAALAAGLPEHVPALTVDTQCCGGLDAIALAAGRIASGDAHVVIAGGVESYSRAPQRIAAPGPDGEPRPYSRPPFTPWPDRDPDMIPAAAILAEELRIGRAAQEDYAAASHAKALRAVPMPEIVSVRGLDRDAFTRQLRPAACARLPVLAGDSMHGVTAATVAVEADAAAAVLVVSQEIARNLGAGRALSIIGASRRGGDPVRPGLAPIAATTTLLNRHGLHAADIAVAEIMEAFAVQAMACIDGIGLDRAYVNKGGGALARGHPIGASGAVLAVRLWHELVEHPGSLGIATIAAAGGLATALVARSSDR